MKPQVAKKRVKRDFLTKLKPHLNLKKRDISYLHRKQLERARQHTIFNNFNDEKKNYLEHNQNNVLSQTRFKALQQKDNQNQNNQEIQFTHYGNGALPLQTDYNNNGVNIVGGYENDLDQLNWNGILGEQNNDGTHNILFYNKQKYEVPNDQFYLDQWYLVSLFFLKKK